MRKVRVDVPSTPFVVESRTTHPKSEVSFGVAGVTSVERLHDAGVGRGGPSDLLLGPVAVETQFF